VQHRVNCLKRVHVVEHFAVAPASGPVKPPIRLSKDAPPVAALPVARPPVTLQAPVAGPMVYLAWSLPRVYSANGALLRAIRSALAADRIWMSANSAIKSIRTTLVAGREGSTLVCAAALKQGRDPEKSLEKILDQIHRFSETDATSGPKDGEEDVGFQDSAAGYVKPDSARTLGTAGLSVSVDVQIPRYKMTAAVDYVMEMEAPDAGPVGNAPDGCPGQGQTPARNRAEQGRPAQEMGELTVARYFLANGLRRLG
jgi:hypothetical protein